MIQDPNLGVPDSVPAGSTSPIEVSAPGADLVSVTVSATGEVLFFKPDDSGKFRFELPPGAASGTTILVSDEDDPSRTAAIFISPAP